MPKSAGQFPRSTLPGLVCAFLVLVPATAVAQVAVDVEALAAGIAERHILPRYQAMSTAMTALRDSLGDDCAAGDVAAVHGAYDTAMDAWMAVQHLRFSPVMRDDRHVRIQYWPDKHNVLTRHLAKALAAGDNDMLAPEAFAATSVALQGFPALERLLFEDGFPRSAVEPFGCRLAGAIARNLATIAEMVEAEWLQGVDPALVAEGLVDSVMTQLQVTGELKLLRPLGENVEQARPRLAESWRSGRSSRNLRINYEALADLYSGGEGKDLRTAVAPASEGSGWLAALDDGFRVAAAAAGRLEEPLRAALTDEEARKTVKFLGVHSGGLRELVAKSVAPALGVTVGFNSLDGD